MNKDYRTTEKENRNLRTRESGNQPENGGTIELGIQGTRQLWDYRSRELENCRKREPNHGTKELENCRTADTGNQKTKEPKN